MKNIALVRFSTIFNAAVIALCVAAALIAFYFFGECIHVYEHAPLPQGSAVSIDIGEAAAKWDGNIPQTGFFILVDLDSYYLEVYENSVLMGHYPVSGGKKSTPSPQGLWHIQNKERWGGGFGAAWLGLNVPWGKFGIHGTSRPWVIGRSNASGGCVRMYNDDVMKLFKTIPIGTPVRIIQKKLPVRVLKSGDFGSDVLQVQAALQRLGYYSGDLDGKFGKILAKAVEKYQADFGLPVTGTITQSTRKLLF